MAVAQIVYATITGNNEDIASIIADTLEENGLEVSMTEISQADISEFEAADLCIVCSYTYDEGSLPDEGLDFFEDLQEADLTGKIYGVAGSGDDFYGEYFGMAVDKFDQAFAQAKATKGAANVKINLAPDSPEDIATLEKFANELTERLNG